MTLHRVCALFQLFFFSLDGPLLPRPQHPFAFQGTLLLALIPLPFFIVRFKVTPRPFSSFPIVTSSNTFSSGRCISSFSQRFPLLSEATPDQPIATVRPRPLRPLARLLLFVSAAATAQLCSAKTLSTRHATLRLRYNPGKQLYLASRGLSDHPSGV